MKLADIEWNVKKTEIENGIIKSVSLSKSNMKAYVYEQDDFLRLAYLDDDENPDNHYIDATRAEWADKYYPNYPPALAWMQNNYEYACGHCEHLLNYTDGYCDACMDNLSESLDEEGNPISPADLTDIVFDKHNVFCSSVCLDAYHTQKQKIKDAIEKTETSLLIKFPFVKITRGWQGGPGSCSCYHKDRDNVAVSFEFEGSKIVDTGCYCGGCKQVWICNGDLEQWQRLKQARVMDRLVAEDL